MLMLVLDENRRVVFANHHLQDTLGLGTPEALLGMRPGDLFGCSHAQEHPGGCGESPSCQYCGALMAIRDALAGESAVRECRLTTTHGTARDYRVWAVPYQRQRQTYVVFSLLDISAEKRREALERTFFHDLLNTAGGISGMTDLLVNAALEPAERNEVTDIVHRASHRLLDEIRSAQILALAEAGDVVLSPTCIDVAALVGDLRKTFTRYPGGETLNFELPSPPEGIALESDATILVRILANLLKNAIEASSPGDTVALTVETDAETVRFHVANSKAMPLAVQRQVFQRSFSTKGPGRGLGTYSVRLFTEQYLGGRVSFTSSVGKGTIFTVTLPQRAHGSPDTRNNHRFDS